jgi:hypothetical protein
MRGKRPRVVDAVQGLIPSSDGGVEDCLYATGVLISLPSGNDAWVLRASESDALQDDDKNYTPPFACAQGKKAALAISGDSRIV